MSEHWKVQETRCISRSPRDRARCKVKTPAGEYLCEHHKYDLAEMANDPQTCIDIMAERFPKRHHPACDRKGENDCDCHDYSRGASAMITLKAAFEQSKLQSNLYKKHVKVTMAAKVRRIRKYYRSITEEDLYLPPNSNFRQYRFFVWDSKMQKISVRILKDTVRNKTILLSHLRRLAPLQVFYTTGQWLNPQGIGPDPESRHGEAKMRKKNWCTKETRKVTLRRYHNTLLKRDLYFDVDYDNKDYNQGIQMVDRLIEKLDEKVHYEHGSVQIVFSGSKGFHLIVDGYYDGATLSSKESEERARSIDLEHPQRYLRNRANVPDKNKVIEGHYKAVVNSLKSDDLLLDWMVTYDNRRIIRLPGTVHGKTMRVCQIIDTDDESVIKDRHGGLAGYIPAPPIP